MSLIHKENLSVSSSNKKFGIRVTKKKATIKNTISGTDIGFISCSFFSDFELKIQKIKNRIIKGKLQIL